MAAIATHRLRNNHARRFIESLKSTSGEIFYFYLAQNTNWLDEDSPDAPVDSVDVNTDIFADLITLRRITDSDARQALKRYNWTSGTVYQNYDDTLDLFDYNQGGFKPFFVINSSFNVYKCLDNNGGAVSTVEPSSVVVDETAQIVELADGYRWKYMLGISAADSNRFVSTNWMPISYVSIDDGSNQFDVQDQSVDGIDTLVITAGGTGYQDRIRYNTLPSQAALATTEVKLDASASASDDFYNGQNIYISSGVGIGQQRTISDYVGSTKVATITVAWSPLPVASDTFEIAPAITITSTSGTLAEARIPYNASVDGIDTTNITFNGSSDVIIGADTITSTAHGFDSGDAVVYALGGGGLITSIGTVLTDAGTFYVNAVDLNTIKLYDTAINAIAGTATGLADITVVGSGASQTLTAVGAVQKVVVKTLGSGYRDATVSIANAGVGAGATFRAVIAPSGGHGNDGPQELGAAAIITNSLFEGTESSAILAANDFRQTGILKDLVDESALTLGYNAGTPSITTNPGNTPAVDFYATKYVKILDGPGRGETRLIMSSTSSANPVLTLASAFIVPPTTASRYGILADNSLYNQTTVLDYSSSTGAFTLDEVVTQGSASGNLVYDDTGGNKIYLSNVIGTFTTGTATGVTSTSDATVSVVTEPSIVNFYGDVLVVDHRKKISRSTDQAEQFNVIIEF